METNVKNVKNPLTPILSGFAGFIACIWVGWIFQSNAIFEIHQSPMEIDEKSRVFRLFGFKSLETSNAKLKCIICILILPIKIYGCKIICTVT